MYTGSLDIHSCGVLGRVAFCVLYGLGWPGLVTHLNRIVAHFAAAVI